MSSSNFQPINSNQNTIYLDTSFINHFAKRFNWGDARATKGRQKLKNRIFVISPTNIFELLQIKDEIRRETLIVICQNLFYERSLPSPEELIIRHIKLGCPKAEKSFELVSQNSFALVWEDIVLNTQKTFIYEMGDLVKRKSLLHNFFKVLRNFVKEGRDPRLVSARADGQFVEHDLGKIFSRHNLKLFEMDLMSAFVYMFIWAVVCSEITIDPTPIKQFWRGLRIESPEDRFSYLINQVPECFMHGPAVTVGMMASVQAASAPNAGAMFDCLHSVYLPYMKYFFVRDRGFLKFRDQIDPVLALRISHYDELRITTEVRDVYTASDRLFL